jgi:hypothetical protein
MFTVAILLAVPPAAAQDTAPGPRTARYADQLAHRPTPIPDRVVLTWKGDPATTQAVTWRTDGTVTAAKAQIAESGDGPRFRPRGTLGSSPGGASEVPAASAPFTSDLNDAVYHSVNFTGLKPRTKYVYRVGDGSNWSEWFQFETASHKPEPFSFVYFGDAQNDLKEHWSRVVRGAYSGMPKARFIVHAGDLVDRGNSDAQWGEWFGAAGWINGMVPNVPTPGNHEYTGQTGLTAHWRAQFTLPENGPPGLDETCYVLDFQGVRLISLNSNEQPAEQAEWLGRVLATNRNTWTVVAFHHPIYSPTGRDNTALREAWRPVFDRHGVDLVLTGHDHAYGRSGLMREDNQLSGANVRDGRGTVYVVSVSGPKLYGVSRQDWMKSSAQGKQLYQHVSVDGNTVRYESRTARGDLYDSFELRKRPDGGNHLVELGAPRTASDDGGGYGPAAAAAVILAAVLLGLKWATRRS